MGADQGTVQPLMAGPNAGRQGKRWLQLAATARARETHCFRCAQPLDKTIPYRDADTGMLNQDYVSAEHKLPRSKHPELAEDPGNIAASHLRCNLEAGDREPAPSIGMRSRTATWL